MERGGWDVIEGWKEGVGIRDRKRDMEVRERDRQRDMEGWKEGVSVTERGT